MNADTGPAGNYYDKYNTRNPIARWLMQGFLSSFDRLSGRLPPGAVLEVGCGEGELSMRLAARGHQVRGCDVSSDVVEEARDRADRAGLPIAFWHCDLQDLTQQEAAPLVVCCEVLEHLHDPHAGVEKLASLARPWLLVSVPREPLWRVLNMARGKYLDQWGNTPGHLNHWGRRDFIDLLSHRFDVMEIASPVPWTMALCKVK
ncbi:MAG: class I SAM-dependent methyltransferase [Pseudoxanthomonas sp.]